MKLERIISPTTELITKKVLPKAKTPQAVLVYEKSAPGASRAIFEGGHNYEKLKSSLCNGEIITNRVPLIHRATQAKSTAVATRIKRGNNDFILIRNKLNGEVFGSAQLEYTGCPSFPAKELKEYCKNALEVIRLDTKNAGKEASEYSGIGIDLIKQAVKLSKEKGFGGRIHLNANNDISPTPFYYKCGLRFPSQEKNKLMDEYLKTASKNRTEQLPDTIKQGIMYLPEENIPALLN